MTVQELADRTGVSHSLIKRAEKGDPRCGIGPVFEAAAIVGVSLFGMNQSDLRLSVARQKEILSLLPKAIHKSTIEVKDDF